MQLSEVETRDAELREAETEREHLQRQILDLRFQIAELQALSFEHDDAKNKVTSLQTVLDEKVRRVTSLCVVVSCNAHVPPVLFRQTFLEKSLTKENIELRHSLDEARRQLNAAATSQQEVKRLREQVRHLVTLWSLLLLW